MNVAVYLVQQKRRFIRPDDDLPFVQHSHRHSEQTMAMLPCLVEYDRQCMVAHYSQHNIKIINNLGYGCPSVHSYKIGQPSFIFLNDESLLPYTSCAVHRFSSSSDRFQQVQIMNDYEHHSLAVSEMLQPSCLATLIWLLSLSLLKSIIFLILENMLNTN